MKGSPSTVFGLPRLPRLPHGVRGWVRLLVAMGLGLALLGVVVAFPVDRWTLGVVQWIRGAGVAGAGVFALVYVLAAVLLVPGSVLTLGAGFAYGAALGLLLVSPVSVVAATAAFWVARFLAREWVSQRMAGNARLAAIDAAVGENGFKVVVLLRLSPLLPFNALNLALGLTRVRLRDYVYGSFVGMLPGTFLYVYLGSLVTSASELAAGRKGATAGWVLALNAVGLVTTVAVSILLARSARRALREALGTIGDPDATAEVSH